MAEPVRRLHAVRGDLEPLRESWVRALRAANKAPKTIRSYEQTLRLYTGWLAGRGHSLVAGDVSRDDIRAYLAEQVEANSASTAATRYRGLQQFFRWACDPDEAILATNPMAGMSPPHVPDKPVPLAPDQALVKLLAACKGTTYKARRDTAIIRVLFDCGIRVAECAGLAVEDVDLETLSVTVYGKGRRHRTVPYGARTSQALDRYLRARAGHPGASRTVLRDGVAVRPLWLGTTGRLGAMTTDGLRQMLGDRCAAAKLPHLHPHQLRHTSVDAFLRAGGTERDAMRLFGWKSREMLDRYAATLQDERAQQAARRLSPGDRI